MKSTYAGTRSVNVGDIQCSFALASDSTSNSYFLICGKIMTEVNVKYLQKY